MAHLYDIWKDIKMQTAIYMRVSTAQQVPVTHHKKEKASSLLFLIIDKPDFPPVFLTLFFTVCFAIIDPFS